MKFKRAYLPTSKRIHVLRLIYCTIDAFFRTFTLFARTYWHMPDDVQRIHFGKSNLPTCFIHWKFRWIVLWISIDFYYGKTIVVMMAQCKHRTAYKYQADRKQLPVCRIVT